MSPPARRDRRLSLCIGHWEYGHGEGPRQREPLSAWINRTVQRIKGDIVYKTKYQNGGSSCTCAAE